MQLSRESRQTHSGGLAAGENGTISRSGRPKVALRAWILQKIRAGDKEFVIPTEMREDVLEYVEGVQRECHEPLVLHSFRNMEEESRTGEEASGSLREIGGREEKTWVQEI